MPDELLQQIKRNRSELIAYLSAKNTHTDYQDIQPVGGKGPFRLSSAQRRLWILSQFDDGQEAYNMPSITYLIKRNDIEYIKRAIEKTIDRHEILRTVFKEDESGEIKQWVLDREELGFEITCQDFRKENNSQKKIESYILEDSCKAFDLANGPLLRVNLFQISDEDYLLYFNMHHIIGDQWSMNVLIKDLFAFKEAIETGKEPGLSPLRIQYKDYSNWELIQLEKGAYKTHQAYWLDLLSGELPQINLPGNRRRPRIKTGNGRTLNTYFDKDLSSKLKTFCQVNGGTIFMGVLASFNAVLNRYTGNEHIIIGTPKSGREHVDLHGQIGFYLNTLALKNEVSPSENFYSLFSRVKKTTLVAYEHQMYPFDRLVEELNLHRDRSRHPVFDVMAVVLDKVQGAEGFELEKEQVDQIVAGDNTTSKFDLILFVREQGDYFSFSIEFNTDVYEEEMIAGLMRHYKNLLSNWLSNPDHPLASIAYLSQEDRKKQLESFNATKVAYRKKTVKELFEEQAEKIPEKLALSFEDQTLTYQELNARSNALANCLIKEYNISKTSKVAVLLDRSVESVVSMIAAIKSGACYVSVDPNYPTDRVAYIVKDSAADVIISTAQLSRKHGLSAYQILDLAKTDLRIFETSNPSQTNDLSEACFIIYTSGSTGIPKGVVQTQRMMSNLIQWEMSDSGLERDLKHLQYVSFSFDVHVQDCWAALCGGGTLYLAPESIRLDFLSLWTFIKDQGIQVLSFPFSTFRQLVEENSHLNLRVAELKHLICSGEQLIINSTLQRFFEANPQLYLHNHYGPSETHLVTSSTLKSELGITVDSNILIGRPASNCQLYILDASRNLVAQGVEGEIYIGGDGLALGYLNKEELTAQKFIESPFTKGERLYKSGDLGRWTNDGEIQYTGRIDHQVKIRGNRIELEEIEHALEQHKEIKQAVVLAKANQAGEKELVAYITASKAQNATSLRSYLNGLLPDYMLPSYYVQLEELPLTSNGKLNRLALPSPDGSGLSSGVAYVAPRNELEDKLVGIWKKVLQKENIGVNDDFFALGGHSLKAIRMSNEYQKELAVKLTLKELFAHTSLAAHAALIESATREAFVQIEKVTPQASYPISDAQRRLWVLSQFEGGSAAYNMPASLKLNGKYELSLFARAFDSLIDRHEILRTVFREDASGEIRQWILERQDLGFAIDYRDFRSEVDKHQKAQAYIAADAHRAFDLEQGPLLRAALLQVEEDEYVFYFNMHHIISDGWSMEVLSKDVLAYYEAYQAGKQPQVKQLRIQYKDYSAWQLGQLNQESFKAHQAYWLDKLSGELPLLDLPATKQRPRIKTNRGHGLSTYIDSDTTGKLRKYSQKNGGSLFMGLLAAWNALMYRYTAQTNIITGTAVSGREHTDLEDQIGFYINTLALKNEVMPGDSFHELFSKVKQNTLRAYSHQMYPFDRLVEELDLPRNLGRSAVFDVMLVLQNSDHNTENARLSKEKLSRVADLGQSAAKFDIDISFKEVGEYLSLHVVYNTDVYELAMMERLVVHYRQLLNAVLQKPEEKISHVDYLSEAEKHQLLDSFNNTRTGRVNSKTLVDLFEEQAAKTPDHVAVVFEERKLTYRALNAKANQLANYLLQRYKVGGDEVVGIRLERSEWVLIAILGVLKSGGAYIPIDPRYPEERIDYMLADSRCKLVIDANEIKRFTEEKDQHSSQDPKKTIKQSQLAYIIYTSGSTGKPKGVMIEHKSVASFFEGCKSKFNLMHEAV